MRSPGAASILEPDGKRALWRRRALDDGGGYDFFFSLHGIPAIGIVDPA